MPMDTETAGHIWAIEYVIRKYLLPVYSKGQFASAGSVGLNIEIKKAMDEVANQLPNDKNRQAAERGLKAMFGES